jgi:hypothetical protein
LEGENPAGEDGPRRRGFHNNTIIVWSQNMMTEEQFNDRLEQIETDCTVRRQDASLFRDRELGRLFTESGLGWKFAAERTGHNLNWVFKKMHQFRDERRIAPEVALDVIDLQLPLIKGCVEALRRPGVGRQVRRALDHLHKFEKTLRDLFPPEEEGEKEDVRVLSIP